MNSKTTIIVTSILMIAVSGLVYLYHEGTLHRRFPEAGRFLDRHLRSGDSPLEAVLPDEPGDSSSLLDGIRSKAEPVLPSEKTVSEMKETFNPTRMFKRAGDVPGKPEVLYSWLDENGVRHYSNTRPPADARDVREIRR